MLALFIVAGGMFYLLGASNLNATTDMDPD
jgi:hypothetical protein